VNQELRKRFPTCGESSVKRIVLPHLAVVLALLGEAHAQDNRSYCTQLSELYRKYVQNAPGRGFDVEATVALEDCRKGNEARAIPVLEKKLRDNHISPPGGGEFKP
jgi:hypothetical protein